MSCAQHEESFRLLDARTGWETEASAGLDGLDDPVGLRLAQRLAVTGAVHVADSYQCLHPPRVAVDPAGRLFRANRTRLRVLDFGSQRWNEVVLPDEPVSISALSWGRGLLAVADAGARRVDLLRGAPFRQVLRLNFAGRADGRPRLVALTPWSLVAVITEDPAAIVLIGLDGLVRRRSVLPMPDVAELGMACVRGEDGDRLELLVAVRLEQAWRRLFRIDNRSLAASPVPVSAIHCQPPSGVRIQVGDDGSFRIEPGDDPPDPQVPDARRYAMAGWLRTIALDSGVDDCAWHRVRVDADQPPGTVVTIRLATTTELSRRPDDTQWQTLPPGASDALVLRPPGRYLHVKLELSGDGRETPVVRSVRADFDVTTSLDRLPAAYQPAPGATFTKRFLSLFDASFGELDEAIRLAPLLLDPRGIPDHVLPALAARVGIPADPAWPPDRLRRLLVAWPRLAPLLGTPRGLRFLIAVVYGVSVAVEEPGRARPWGSAGHARLGQVRLFGLSRASLRLGTGRLGEALLEPSTDPLAPAYGSGAYRCVVHVPAGLPVSQRPSLEALVRAVLPVHVSAEVRYAATALEVGPPLAVGVATRLGRLEAGVLAGGDQRAIVLGRRGPLGPGHCGGAPVTVGRRSIAGITT
jgi:phage tail-like protein